jgi:hypothetical protein
VACRLFSVYQRGVLQYKERSDRRRACFHTVVFFLIPPKNHSTQLAATRPFAMVSVRTYFGPKTPEGA